MPRKREGGKQVRVHVWVFAKDWRRLKKMCSGKQYNTPSYVVRHALTKELDKPRAPQA